MVSARASASNWFCRREPASPRCALRRARRARVAPAWRRRQRAGEAHEHRPLDESWLVSEGPCGPGRSPLRRPTGAWPGARDDSHPRWPSARSVGRCDPVKRPHAKEAGDVAHQARYRPAERHPALPSGRRWTRSSASERSHVESAGRRLEVEMHAGTPSWFAQPRAPIRQPSMIRPAARLIPTAASSSSAIAVSRASSAS